MKKAALWAVLAIPILLNTKDPLPVMFIITIASVFILRRNSVVFILLILSVFSDVSLDQSLPLSSSSKIVELNDKSFIVSTPQGKVLVYTKTIQDFNLLDEVNIQTIKPFEITPSTYGFDQKSYYQGNNLIGYTEDTDITVTRHHGIMAFLNTGGLNKDPAFRLLVRAVLFQSDPLSGFIQLISLGLIYSILMKMGRYVLSFVVSETWAICIMSGVMGIMAFIFAYPISLIRVIISSILFVFIKDAKNRVIFFVLFFLLYDHNSLKSMAVLYPLMLLVISAFRPYKITQWGMLSLFQISLFHKASLILIIMYPLMRKAFTVLIVLIWFGYGLPWLNPLLFHIHNLLKLLLLYFEKLLIIKGSFSIPVMLGLINIMALSLVLKSKTKYFLCLIVFCIPILSSPWAYQVTLISVGQGDAILLQAPFNQEVILIDTGKPSAYGQVSAFINAQGITDINALIVTHNDNDHSGNVMKIREDYRVMRSVYEPKDLDLAWFHLKSLKTNLKDPTDNQASLVYLFEINAFRFLLMADADEFTESDLLRQYPNLKADILKVGHHGSASSASDEFLSKVEAKLALISVGFNSYGHPSYKTLQRLNDHHVMIMNTRDEGDITIILSPLWNGLKTSSLNLKTLRLGF